MEQGKWTKKWVRKETKPPPLFDPIKEKDTYQKSRKELLEIELIASTSTTPPVYDRTPIYDMPPTYDHLER